MTVQKFSGDDAASQRARILDRLHKKPVSTFDARRDLDIPHPAARGCSNEAP
jgi:hypothetical protein